MIVDLHKYLIFGTKEEMAKFFALAQRAGFLEFIAKESKRQTALPEDAKTLLAAIRIAKHHPVHPKEAPSTPHEPIHLAEKILALAADHEKLLEEERVLGLEISRISIFGDFSRSELDQLEVETKRTLQFFCRKSDLAHEMEIPNELIPVGTDYDLDYFVSINKEKIHPLKMSEIFIDRPVGVLRDRLMIVREELGRVENDLRTYANGMALLEKGLVECLNIHALEKAQNEVSFPLGESFFTVQAWVPKTRIQSLYALLSHLNIDCAEITIDPHDQIPTCMENKGVSKVGEDLVQVYDVPAYTDKDPSTWVLIFFSLFFAMIISDAGYGLLFLLATLAIRWRLGPLEGAGRRFLKMSFILSSFCIVWGVLTSSYFGIQIAPSHFSREYSPIQYLASRKAAYHLEQKDDVYEEFLKQYPQLTQAKTGEQFLELAVTTSGHHPKYTALDTFYDNLFMETSFLIGIFHVSLAFLRYFRRHWAGIGWIFFMVGGYLYFPSVVNATVLVNFMGWIPKPTAHFIGIHFIFGGLSVAFFLSVLQKKWGALAELLHIVQLFADVLSYLRIYALSLAGMVVAHTFNDRLGLDLGLIASLFVILLGHSINITLSIMGGVIHGLRLNFLEWYHYCFEGGGRLFNPLRIKRTR